MKYLIIYLTMLMLFFGMSNAQRVTNVNVYMDDPDSIVVMYDLDTISDIQIYVSNNLGKTYTSGLTRVSGDIGKNIKGGIDKSIVIAKSDPLIDYNLNVLFKVKVINPIRHFTVRGISFDMILVEGGTFKMGCVSKDKDCYDDEFPVSQVTLSDYYIAKLELTQELWNAVMEENPSKWKNDSLPVDNVSWNKTQEFLQVLNRLTGENFRLPTEAEWEFAARGGTKSKNYKFSGSNDATSVAWYAPNSGWKTNNVGLKKPNELGIYDMSGNVWEWCSNWRDKYTRDEKINPKGTASTETKVIRGGCWNSPARGCRVTDRNSYTPSYAYDYYGFRLALDF